MNIQYQSLTRSPVVNGFLHGMGAAATLIRSTLVVILLALLAISAIHFTSHYVLAAYDANILMRAAVPSKGLFQVANILFWSVMFFCCV